MTLRHGTLLTVAAAIAATAAAWTLPAQKDGAVGGRLDYLQFAIAVTTTATAISVVAVAACSAANRRRRLLRVTAVWLGTGVAVIVSEIAGLAWPTRHLMDNPWYLSTGQGIEIAEELPYRRPANMNWTGYSRGDLAMPDNTPDPHARRVTFATDAEGFRNPIKVDQAEIIVLGDSITEAGNIPYEETFVALLGERTGWRVRNLGVAGYTSPIELIVLKRFGLKYSPKWVVWQITESNDLTEAQRFAEWTRAGRPDFKMDPDQLPTRWEAWQRRSPSRMLFNILCRPKHWPLAGTFRDHLGRKHEVRFRPALPSAMHSPLGHPGWPLMANAIREGAQILNARKIALIVVLIPMKLRVMADATDLHESTMQVNGDQRTFRHHLPEGWDLNEQATLAVQLRQLCDELGARFVNTMLRLKQHTTKGNLVYLPLDSHLSPTGHRIVCDLIVEAIGEQRFDGDIPNETPAP